MDSDEFVSSQRLKGDEVSSLAEKYGTPLFVFFEEEARRRVRWIRNTFGWFSGRLTVAYSIKANFNPSLLKVFISEGCQFDVTSLGELYFYLKSGGNGSRVIYTSVSEERGEFLEVLRSGVKRVVVSSSNGLKNLKLASEEVGLRPRVLLRVNPEVETKASVKASHKFGALLNSDGDESAGMMLERIFDWSMEFEGFHFHLGSQITDPSCFPVALDKLRSFAEGVGLERFRVMDVGGGIPVCYGSRIPSLGEFSEKIREGIEPMVKGFGVEELVVESGRYLSAYAGNLITKAVNVKRVRGKKLVFLDAGYHILLDAALLGQEYPQFSFPKGKENEEVVLFGRLCDAYDSFPISPTSDLKGVEIGSYVVFENVGAYSLVFGMPFHCSPKPPVVMKFRDGSYKLIRKGEEVKDLFKEEGSSYL